jgi:DNA-binding CsgD family transcriptional regulator
VGRPRLAGCDAELLDRLYEAPFEPKGWSPFLLALERFLGGTVGMLCMPAPSFRQPGVVIAPSEAYRRRYHRIDPWLREARLLPAGEIISRRGAVGGQPLVRTPFYREWMAPQGLRAEPPLGGVLERDEQGGCTLITLFRRSDARPGRRVSPVLADLMPHLRRAVRMHAEHARLHADRRSLAAALDRLPMAVIVVDRRHHVHLSNQRGDGLLARRDGLVLDRDGLHGTRPEEDLRLRRALAEVCDAAEGSDAGVSLTIARSPGRAALRASVLRVPPQEGTGLGTGLAALFVSDPEEPIELPAATLKQLYGLTRAESALVRELANGRSVQEAARQLGITEGTARQRLVQVFGKTGTRRQANLVWLVLTGPESLRTEG